MPVSALQVFGGGAPIWTSGVTYALGQEVRSPLDKYQLYTRITAAGSGTTDPMNDAVNYFKPGSVIKSRREIVAVISQGSVNVTVSISPAVVAAKSVLLYTGGTASTYLTGTFVVPMAQIAGGGSSAVFGMPSGFGNGTWQSMWTLLEFN